MSSADKKQVLIFTLLTAVLLAAAGLARREHVEVMEKAVTICLECIGIG